jgi:hypothetical protein
VLIGFLAACAAPCLAQNQVANPGFVSGLGSWTVLSHPGITNTYDATQGSGTPGALRVSTSGATTLNYVVVRQCLPVTPGGVVDFGGKYRFESGHAVNLKGNASVAWFTDGGCTTGGLTGVSTNIINDIPNTWLPIHANNVVVPAGRNSAYFLLVIGISAGEGVAWFDDVYFGPDPLPVELMSFGVE